MPIKRSRAATHIMIAALFLSLPLTTALAQQTPTVGEEQIAAVQRQFVSPPDDARVMMRWWWFGPAVTKPELQREILAMKAGGIGGFEIQPVYPLALDDKQKNFRNLPYLSNDFLDAVSFVAKTARENGMRVDMTLASGWPYGGKHVPIDEAASRLKVVAADLPPGAASLPTPAMENGERLIAVFIGDGSSKQYDAENLKQLATNPGETRLQIAASPTPRVVVFYIASRTGQQVKRAAVDAEGFVLDHFNKTAVENHLKTVGDPLMQAFGDTPPYAVFSDSLEVYGADWTDDLLTEFKQRRGYDLTPHLPQLVSGTDETSAEVRHDWGQTLTELIDERYLIPINDWAKAHHTQFRSQTYGDPAVSMSSNSLVALPEGEGPQWDRFSYTRWATSASHLYGRPITSGETWTWLHSPPFSATPLDMKAEADRFFLEGVNQLIGHGWPYSPPDIPEPGWSFYAAAVFNDHNPWWMVMPDVTKYLQRVSYLLRQGKPANDVAVLLPNDDAYAQFKLGAVSLSDEMSKYITPELAQQILNAGYNFDYIDAEAIQKVGIPYPVLILPHVERLSPETLGAIELYAEHGGKVVLIGSTPSHAPGFTNAEAVSSVVKKMTQKLLEGKNSQSLTSDEQLGAALRSVLEPDIQFSVGAASVGFLHRTLKDADIYFVANTSNQHEKSITSFRKSREFASVWDPLTGDCQKIEHTPMFLDLAPYQSVVVVFSDTPLVKEQPVSSGTTSTIADLTNGWTMRFPAEGAHPELEQKLQAPRSWTDDTRTRYFSGTVVYTKTIHLSESALSSAHSVQLDFGEGTPIAADPNIKSGMRALLDGPIRETAVVYINGQRAGTVWHPPYTIDVTQQLHAGENQIEIRVANTAINMLAGRAPADYHLLNARYGQRFVPMDTEDIKPLPSGILGTVHLTETK